MCNAPTYVQDMLMHVATYVQITVTSLPSMVNYTPYTSIILMVCCCAFG